MSKLLVCEGMMIGSAQSNEGAWACMYFDNCRWNCVFCLGLAV